MKTDEISAACASQFKFLVQMGDVFLWVALIGGILLMFISAAESVIRAYKISKVASPEAGNGPGLPASLDSLRSFVTALSQAPVWLALFIAGVALIWMSPNWLPKNCGQIPTLGANASTDVPKGDAPSHAANSESGGK